MLRRTLLVVAAAAAAGAQNDLSNFAAGVLDQTRQARRAIAARDRDAAVAHVRNAMATASLIEEDSPKAPRPLMVPISRSVDATAVIAPVKKRGQLKKNSSIQSVEGRTTTSQLDVTAVGDRLPAAQRALESGDWNSADSILAAAENSVVVTETNGEMPLRAARKNLELAKMRVREGKYRDAEAPLRSAAESLAEYESRVSGPEAADIEAARQTMLVYSPRLDRANAAARIDSWLAMARAWSNGR